MRSGFDRPPRSKMPRATDSPTRLGLVSGMVTFASSSLGWRALVAHVLEGVTPEHVRCALGIDDELGAQLLARCRASASFEQMYVKDVPQLSSLANWVYDVRRVHKPSLTGFRV